MERPYVIYQRAFAAWVGRMEMIEAWEKSLREMSYCDWTIHRKLGEAAGLAHRYIIPARGSGKSMFEYLLDEEDL